MQPPRKILAGCSCDVLVRRDFYSKVLQARYIAASDKRLPGADFVFTEYGIEQLRRYLTASALQTPTVLTERLSSRVIGVHLVQSTTEQFVVLNMRLRTDPDLLAHTTIEEYVHAQQFLDGVDFEQQRSLYAYRARPYEQEAKRIATDILGYDPESVYEVMEMRPEPSEILYDRSLPNR